MTRRRASRPAGRLLLIFAATILTPGVILGGFGLRALTQERQNAKRQARDTLDVVAKDLGPRLELDLKDWQQAAGELARTASVDPSQWPARVRDAVTRPGAGVVLLGSLERLVGTQVAIFRNGYTYNLVELAYFSWFFNAPTTPSLAASGAFSSNGTFKGPSMACPPGGTY